jgi:NTP pyrophosphatase (non-canonical NTP hydrolase)
LSSGRPCTICTHPLGAQITKALVAGGSKRTTAARFGVNEASVQRHRRNCLRIRSEGTSPAAAAEQARPAGSGRFDRDNPKELVSMTARLVDEALELLEHAKTQKDTRTALSALREARDGLALLMRAAGMLAGDGTTIAIDARRQSIEVISGLSTDDLRRLAALSDDALDVTDNRSLSRAVSGPSDALNAERGPQSLADADAAASNESTAKEHAS